MNGDYIRKHPHGICRGGCVIFLREGIQNSHKGSQQGACRHLQRGVPQEFLQQLLRRSVAQLQQQLIDGAGMLPACQRTPMASCITMMASTALIAN